MILETDQRRALIRSFRLEGELGFAAETAVAVADTGCDKARQGSQPLCAADSLNVFVQDLISRWPANGWQHDIVIFHWRSGIQIVQRDRRLWSFLVAMAGKARYALCSPEVLAVDGGDHLDHTACR